MDPLSLISTVASILAVIFTRPRKETVVELPGPSTLAKDNFRIKLGPKKVVLAPAFNMVFITIALITVVSGIGHVFLADIWTAPTPNQQSAFEAIGFAWKAGIGALFGLLGGKVT